jgi:putative transcriptional regulator
VKNTSGRRQIVVEIRVDELLEEHGRSFYWLAKETGISHTTLWRLKKGKALGINFVTLEKICRGLNCQPGDVLGLANEKKTGKRQATRSKYERS